MGSSCSSEHLSKAELVSSEGEKDIHIVMDGKRRPVRTKSVVEGEVFDGLLLKHPELKPTLREFDRVISKLKEMDGKITEDTYSDLYSLLDKYIDDPFQDKAGLEERQVLGNYLAKHGFVPYLVDVYQAVWSNHDLEFFDDDLEEDESESAFFKLLQLIRTILWNYADGSSKFAESIVNDTPLFQYLTEDLLAVKDDLEDLEDEITNENHFPFNSTLGILNNCARNAATKEVYNVKRLMKKGGKTNADANMVEILENLLKTDITYVKLVVLLALSYMVNEEQNKELSADESIFDFLLDMVHKAEKSKDRRQWGFSIHELINGLAKLAKNDENKEKIMNKGAFASLKRILKHGIEAEQIAVVNVIWELCFSKKNKDLFKNDKEVWKTLQALCNSETEELAKAAQGACFVINEGQDREREKSKPKEKNKGHIMLSYNWADQKILLQIRDRLQQRGMSVWMDVDNMEGSILEAMARAVEDARIVLVCYSEKYKDSQNCRTEAEYAYSQKKDIVPLRMQKGYAATGWLGIMIGAKLFYDFSGKYDFDKKFGELDSALSGKILTKGPKLSTITENGGQRSLMSSSEDETIILLKWTKADMQKWLNHNQLTAFSGLKNLSGEQLVFLYKLFRRASRKKKYLIRSRKVTQLSYLKLGKYKSRLSSIDKAPEYFYRCIEEKLGMKSLEDLMKFSDAIEKLQTEHPDINRLVH